MRWPYIVVSSPRFGNATACITVTAAAVQQLHWHQHWPHIHSLHHHHMASSHCPASATQPRIAVAAAAIIAVVVAIATVATTTRVPHSTFLFAPRHSPSAGELCSGCAGTSFVGHVHPRFVAITRRHRIAPPRQHDLSRCCRRCHYCHCITIATVANTTIVPRSDGRNLQDSTIALPEVPEA